MDYSEFFSKNLPATVEMPAGLRADTAAHILGYECGAAGDRPRAVRGGDEQRACAGGSQPCGLSGHEGT